MLQTCTTILRRVIPAIGGKWIPFTAAQVAARRAAQMVAIVVCTSIPIGGANSLPPLPNNPPQAAVSLSPFPQYPNLERIPTWDKVSHHPYHLPHPIPNNVPEPASMFGFMLLGLGAIKLVKSKK